MSAFIILEITDPQINALFSAIWKITSGNDKPKRAHVTLRGPYKDIVPEEQILQCKKLMMYDVLRISGVGIFTNEDEYVVFIKVNSPNLRETWWKPDYPINEYGFEPHISLYRGPNKKLANLLFEIFKNENLDLKCAEHRIIVNKIHEMDLFVPEYRVGGSFEMLISNNNVSCELLEKIENAVKLCSF